MFKRLLPELHLLYFFTLVLIEGETESGIHFTVNGLTSRLKSQVYSGPSSSLEEQEAEIRFFIQAALLLKASGLDVSALCFQKAVNLGVPTYTSSLPTDGFEKRVVGYLCTRPK